MFINVQILSYLTFLELFVEAGHDIGTSASCGRGLNKAEAKYQSDYENPGVHAGG